jgi:signal peptidase II
MFGCAVAAASLDQVSKSVVVRHLPAGCFRPVARGCGLRRVHNGAGGMLGLSTGSAVLVWIAVVVCLAFVGGRDPAVSGNGATVGLGLALGGATGNLVDRVVRGGVVDFVAVGRWPAFNVADAALVLGVVLTAWSLM